MFKSTFFSTKTLEEIHKHISPPKIIDNFINENEIKELINFIKQLKSNLVEREESTKISFDFEDNQILKNIQKKIVEVIGEFYVNDFKPHFITSRFPLRIHADTGKDPEDVIFKNVVLPLEIKSRFKRSAHTVIFKNKWFNRSALFTTKTKEDYDYIIKDINGNFRDIYDIRNFLLTLKNSNENEIIQYLGASYKNDKNFYSYIENLSKGKRYNLRTDKHITNDVAFDKEIYDQYMTHQPYEDLTGMEVEKIFEWKPGSLIIFNRVHIHSSDNFLKNNNVESKTFMAFFTSKTKKN